MRKSIRNDAWDAAVEQLARRLNRYVWLLRISLSIHDAENYYTQLNATEQTEYLRVMGWVGDAGQEAPMNLSLEQFWHITDVWRQFHEKYQSGDPEAQTVSMFLFLHSVMEAGGISADGKKRLYRAMLNATIIYHGIFGQAAAEALEYIVLVSAMGEWALRPVEDEFQCGLVTSQFENHSAYCKKVSDCMKTKFGAAVILKPTGGDFHNHGKTPLFVSYRGTEYVLKPRNMLEEQCINEMVGLFNRTMRGINLPVSGEIEQITVDGEHYALVRKSVRQKTMTRDQAYSYYEKVGALLFMIKLFGIEDIHMENMMTTEAGPVIIDGECLFYYAYWHQKNMYNAALTLLVDGFNDALEISGLTDNAYLLLTSTMQCAAVSSIGQLTEYGEVVTLGFQNAVVAIAQNGDKAGFCARAYEIYRNMVSNRQVKIRVVPVKTSEWKAVFLAAGERLTESCEALRDSVKDALPRYFEGVVGSEARNYEWVADATIDGLIEQSIRRGDVPFFYLQDVTSGQGRQKLGFILEETVICTIDLDRVSEGVRAVFEENLDWLLGDEAFPALCALLVKQTYPPRRAAEA